MLKKKESIEEIDKNHKECSCEENCKCKNSKKYNLKIFIVIFIGMFLFLGGLITGAVLLYKNDEVINERCNGIESDESDVDSNKTEIKLFSKDDLPYTDIRLKSEEDILAFVNSLYFSDEEARKEFFTNEGEYSYLPNLQSFEVSYVLNGMFGHMSEYMNPMFISEELIIEEMSKVFSLDKNYSLPYVNNFSLNGQHHYLSCAEGICIVNVAMGGVGVGNPSYDVEIISSRKEGKNTIYTLEDYYNDPSYDEKNNSFTYSKEKVGTYEMTFDKDNRYVSSRKVK